MAHCLTCNYCRPWQAQPEYILGVVSGRRLFGNIDAHVDCIATNTTDLYLDPPPEPIPRQIPAIPGSPHHGSICNEILFFALPLLGCLDACEARGG